MSTSHNVTTAPVAPRRPHSRVFHQDEFVDHYEWMRDKDNPEVIAYLNAENDYTLARTAHLDGLTTELFDEIKSRTKETDQSVPDYVRHGNGAYWHYVRTLEGKDYPVYCRVGAPDIDNRPDCAKPIPGEEILLDGNVEIEGHEFFSLGGLDLSPSGDRMAYLVDNDGSERFTLKIKDLKTGEVFHDQITDLGYGIAWAGEDWIFYTRVDDAWRQYQIWRHKLGTDPANDQLVLQEDDQMFSVGVQASRDESSILIAIYSTLTSEWLMIPTTTPEAQPRMIAPRQHGVDYFVEHAGDRLFIVHNANCTNFELAQAPLDATSMQQWETIIAGQDNTRISQISAYQDWAVISLRRNGLPAVHVLPRSNGEVGSGDDIAFSEEVYEVDGLASANWDSERMRLKYTSLVTPATDLEYHFGSKTLLTLKQQEILDDPQFGRYDPTEYITYREWALAADGTKIPISVVHRKDLVKDGSHPCLLYGYGSYETCIPTTFQIPRICLLERGFVYAIAHIRGGGEMGRQWYDNGKMLHKKNTFTDFVAAADHLIAQGFTSPQRLAAQGRSAGGLLMGAVTNLAPQTFRAVHAGVPFVDALTTICMPELPLTASEWEEWGNPIQDPEVYAYMKSYTPYENIKPVDYPAILATTGLNDTRVLYVEPAKWIAELRHTVPDSSRMLLHTEMVAGHGGVSGRYGKWKQTAFEFAWIIDEVSSCQAED